MLDTLRYVIEAHGGLENWNKHKALSAHLVVGGMLWGLKGQFGKLERTNVTVGLGEEWASHQPFGPGRMGLHPPRGGCKGPSFHAISEAVNGL